MSTPNPAVILPLRWLIAIRCDRFIDEVLAHTRLREDLHLDSIEMAELLIDIEDNHGVTLDADVLATVQTVADLEAAVTRRQPDDPLLTFRQALPAIVEPAISRNCMPLANGNQR